MIDPTKLVNQVPWDFLFSPNMLMFYFAFMIVMAVVAYLIAVYCMRKVFPRVEYHRKGVVSETHPCMEKGNRVTFTPSGSKFRIVGGTKPETLTAIIAAKPELKVFGFKNIRLHHVIEGFGFTVDIRDLKMNPETAAMGMPVGTSMAVADHFFEAMGKSWPKGKIEWLMTLMAIFMGIGMGFMLGVFFGP